MKISLFSLCIFILMVLVVAIIIWLVYEYFLLTLNFRQEDVKLYYQRLQ